MKELLIKFFNHDKELFRHGDFKIKDIYSKYINENLIENLIKQQKFNGYDYMLFKHKNKFKNLIFKENEDHIKKAIDLKVLINNQPNEFKILNNSIKKFLEHSNICYYKHNNHSVEFAVKTNSPAPYYYWSEINLCLKKGGIIEYTKGSYLSDVKYTFNLNKDESLSNNSVFYSIKGNKILMDKFNYSNLNLLSTQVDVFENKIKDAVSIDNLKKANFSILPHSYYVVKLNWKKCLITDEAYFQFIMGNKDQLQGWGIEVESLNICKKDEE